MLATVAEAEQCVIESQTTKAYLGIDGSPQFGVAVRQLLFGPGHEVIESGRAVTAQTPGGTGALRVAGDFIRRVRPDATLWHSDPTWPNHPKVFAAAGITLKTYPYFDPATNGLALDEMLATLRQIPAGDVVLLHGCCHNPTGIDPDPQQWKQIGDVLAERKLLALVDFAYQGFADGLSEDTAGLLELMRPDCELLVCSSFSKNFSIYKERVGALTVVAGSASAAAAVLSHVKICIRTNYSSPPAHGALIVTAILNDDDLRSRWESEVIRMRDRINGVRRRFVELLSARGVDTDFSFIGRQRGMFSFSGLTREQVQTLRERYSIYIVASGRINVAGITEANIDRLCDAIAEVLAGEKVEVRGAK